MNSEILLVGAGGHSKSCVATIESTQDYAVRGFVGLVEEVGTTILGYPVLGCDDDLRKLLTPGATALVAVGQVKTARHRMRLFHTIREIGTNLPIVVASNAAVSRHSQVGYGTIVMQGAIINAGVRVGENGIINSNALVEHDCVVGDHCHISTGVLVNGGVRIGDRSFIGSGAVIHEGVEIGNDVVIGAGAVVRKNVRMGSTLYGPVGLI